MIGDLSEREAVLESLLRRVLAYMSEDDNPELWDEAWKALGE